MPRHPPPTDDRASEVLERISDGYFTVDDAWRFTYLNPQAATALRRDRDDLLGTTFWEAFPETVDGVFETELRRAMDRGEAVTFDGYYEPFDSVYEVRAYPADEGICVYFQDVTDDRRRERRRVGFESVLDTMGDAVWLVDADRTILYVNRLVTDSMGVSRESLVGEHLEDRLPDLVSDPAQADAYLRLVEAVLDGGRDDARTEFSVGLGDQTVEIELQITATDLDDDRRGAVVVARDVTERKAHERRIVRQKERLETIVSNLPIVLFVVDEDGTFTLSEGRGLWKLGLTPGEVVGKSIDDVYGDHLTISEHVHRALDGEAVHEEVTIDDLVFDTWYEPIATDGAVERVIGIAIDTTERAEYRRRVERQRDQFEILNRIVRHDIRNDMSVAIGWSEELEAHVDETGDPMLELIQHTNRHVVDLTQTVRDFVETLGTDADPELEPTPLDEVLGRQLETRERSYPDASFAVDGEVPAVEVRANEMLSSVFRNVLNNAVQHNDSDDPRVDVSVAVGDDTVTVSIADDGPGIPDANRGAVLGRSPAGLDDPAAGVGLYLVDTLVDQYGGSIAIEDNDPRGTTFRVTLRRA